MTMRLKLYTLLCASFLFLFTSCNQDDDPVPPEAGSKTVLVYIVADNSLASFAKEDVEEMIEGMKLVGSSSCNLLVYQLRVGLLVARGWVDTLSGAFGLYTLDRARQGGRTGQSYEYIRFGDGAG